MHVVARTLPRSCATCCHDTEAGHHQPSRSYVVVADLHCLLSNRPPIDPSDRPVRPTMLHPTPSPPAICGVLSGTRYMHDHYEVLQTATSLIRTSPSTRHYSVPCNRSILYTNLVPSKEIKRKTSVVPSKVHVAKNCKLFNPSKPCTILILTCAPMLLINLLFFFCSNDDMYSTSDASFIFSRKNLTSLLCCLRSIKHDLRGPAL